MAGWYSTVDGDAQDRVLADWPDAPIENLEVLSKILNTARVQVLRYAPATDLDPNEPSPEPLDNYVLAQLQQAINLWNAGRVNSSGDVGVEGYSYQPRPLDKTVRNIIRPPDGGPDVY